MSVTISESEHQILVRLSQSREETLEELIAGLAAEDGEIEQNLEALRRRGLVFLGLENRYKPFRQVVVVRMTKKGKMFLQQYPRQVISVPETKPATVEIEDGSDTLAPEFQTLRWETTKQLQNLFKPIIATIDSSKDLSGYEKEDLKKKVAEFQQAIVRMDRSEFVDIRSYFSKYFPLVIDGLDDPQINEIILKTFGV